MSTGNADETLHVLFGKAFLLELERGDLETAAVFARAFVLRSASRAKHQTSHSPAAFEPLLYRRNRIVADGVRGPSAVEDGKATGPRESVVIRGDPTKEGEVFKSDLGRSILDPFHSEFRRDSEEDREIGGEQPFSTRILQEPNRIRKDADQPRALVCVRGVCVAVAKDQIAIPEMGANLRDVG